LELATHLTHLVAQLSDRIASRIPGGKYTGWAQHWTVSAFHRLLAAISDFDSAVFSSGTDRRVFPVVNEAGILGHWARVQLPLEALCIIRGATLEASGSGATLVDVTDRLTRLAAPLDLLDGSEAHAPAFKHKLRAILTSDVRTAGFARLDEATALALLWSLGEIRARARGPRDGPHPSTIIESKPYGEPLAVFVGGRPVEVPWAHHDPYRWLVAPVASDPLPFSHAHRHAIEQALKRALHVLAGSQDSETNRIEPANEGGT